MKRALLFDLDETLMVEEPAAVAAFAATRYEIDSELPLAAGFGAVWVNRNGHSASTGRADVVEISTLSDLPEALGE